MIFEVINDKGKTVMNTNDLSCIPNKKQLLEMSTSGYKFKIDGKVISKNKIIEIIKER